MLIVGSILTYFHEFLAQMMQEHTNILTCFAYSYTPLHYKECEMLHSEYHSEMSSVVTVYFGIWGVGIACTYIIDVS